jgi:hypothetical protein
MPPAAPALDFGCSLIVGRANDGEREREHAFLRLGTEENVATKPKKSQARNAGDPNKDQGAASVVGERNPGSTRRNQKPTKWALEVGRS